MALMDDDDRAQYERMKRVINMFNANPDLLRRSPEAIPMLADLVDAVAAIDAAEADARAAERQMREADFEALASAEAIHDTIVPYRKQFLEAGMDEDFLTDLEAYIAELRDSLEIAED